MFVSNKLPFTIQNRYQYFIFIECFLNITSVGHERMSNWVVIAYQEKQGYFFIFFDSYLSILWISL